MKRNFFGTDGIRGIPNKEPLSLKNVVELGRAISYILRDKNSKKKGKVLIGRDTRASGYMLEMAMASGMTAMGLDVFFVGALPTPGIACLIKEMKADIGIVISASHNPYMYNGIKVFDKNGFKLKDELNVLDISAFINGLTHSFIHIFISPMAFVLDTMPYLDNIFKCIFY